MTDTTTFPRITLGVLISKTTLDKKHLFQNVLEIQRGKLLLYTEKVTIRMVFSAAMKNWTYCSTH